ncbi:hypothetical protein BT96DRAFT_987111 [Gymnopus androsaceus JB14]|uniref:Uncharacterized protein n=1 Tax=Gymnopus androsaceus JB14 TaxID=1447944 RepID=A0A6A4I8B7_9AGAR|nr:hypothetical protein BT96DRAFT_987111 [Gymnopus androsaceus JB14]
MDKMMHPHKLKANDRIDPFVAVYEPPSSTRIGNVTHLRWTGFIGPSFVQSLIDLLSTHLTAQSSPTACPEFFSLTSHACTWAPYRTFRLKRRLREG